MAGRVLDLLRPRSPFLSLRLMEGQRVWIAAQRGISSKRPGTVARVPGGNGAGRRHRRDQQSFAVVNHMRASDQVRAITTPSYRNQFICYARTVAYSSGSAMLFSSGDSPQHASFDSFGGGIRTRCIEESHRSLFLQYATCPPRSVLLRNGIKPTALIPGHI